MLEVATKATYDILPEKSKARYEYELWLGKKWLRRSYFSLFGLSAAF